MNDAHMNKFAQSARGENRCGSCDRPWFGLVAYCPYCGREPSFATSKQKPDERFQSDEPEKEPRGTLLFKAAVVGVGALLLLWMAETPPGPKTNEGASAHTISTSGIASPAVGRPTSGAQLTSIQPRTEIPVPPPSNRSLCSVASETAGLCKSQN
jgi:hypothetical protein